MKIFKAEYVKGVIGDDYSAGSLPHVAFLGRSNAGKSSVINSFTGVKNLARPSKTPGKTRIATFFCVNNSFYLVDFPGYGFAKCSVAERNKMIKRIFWYLEFAAARPRAVFLIIDANIGLTALDWEMIEVLRANKHQIVIVANKIDKIAKTKISDRISSIQQEAGDISVLRYSAKTNEGREELIEKIADFV